MHGRPKLTTLVLVGRELTNRPKSPCPTLATTLRGTKTGKNSPGSTSVAPAAFRAAGSCCGDAAGWAAQHICSFNIPQARLTKGLFVDEGAMRKAEAQHWAGNTELAEASTPRASLPLCTGRPAPCFPRQPAARARLLANGGPWEDWGKTAPRAAARNNSGSTRRSEGSAPASHTSAQRAARAYVSCPRVASL